MLFLSWELRDSNRAADRPDPLLGADAARADAQFGFKTKKSIDFSMLFLSWELRDSNPRPSACKADALNQLS
jgi:hypothetical protein